MAEENSLRDNILFTICLYATIKIFVIRIQCRRYRPSMECTGK